MTKVLQIVGSLKITVALLGMSIFLVFVGTLAQVDSGTWTAVHQYFRCAGARRRPRVDFDDTTRDGRELDADAGTH